MFVGLCCGALGGFGEFRGPSDEDPTMYTKSCLGHPISETPISWI